MDRLEADLHQTNEHLIDMLVDMAHHDSKPLFDLIPQIHPLLTKLDSAARRRAAQRPFLLADFKFQDEEWWPVAKTLSGKPGKNAWHSNFPRRAAVQLARRTLILAWHAVDQGCEEVSITKLGLSPKVVEIMLSLRLEDIEHIAECHFAVLRPRWGDRPSVWRRLLHAAQTGDSHSMHSIDIHGAQLLAGDLLRQSG